MSKATLRIIFAGLFGLIALVGALAIQAFTDDPVPEWLIGLIGVAGGYIFGHVQENGFAKPTKGGPL